MQICPAFVNFAHATRCPASNALAVSSTIVGLFPPNSKVTLHKCLLAASITILPTAVEPVKKIWSKRSLSTAVDTSTPPVTTLASSGLKISATSAARADEVFGGCSDGFKRTVFPAANEVHKGCRDKKIG